MANRYCWKSGVLRNRVVSSHRSSTTAYGPLLRLSGRTPLLRYCTVLETFCEISNHSLKCHLAVNFGFLWFFKSQKTHCFSHSCFSSFFFPDRKDGGWRCCCCCVEYYNKALSPRESDYLLCWPTTAFVLLSARAQFPYGVSLRAQLFFVFLFRSDYS